MLLKASYTKFKDVQFGKASATCQACRALWQGLSYCCCFDFWPALPIGSSCFVRSRCCTLSLQSSRSWLQVRATAPADPCSTSLGSR